MKKQILFEMRIGYDYDETLPKLEKLIAEGWFIKLATPTISNGSTRSIIYVLEKEQSNEKEN